VLRNFPPSTHPKLYPYPAEYLERWLRNIGRLNRVITVAGLLTIVGLFLGTLVGKWDGTIATPWSPSGQWATGFVVSFFVVQIVTGVTYMNFSGHKRAQAMAKAPPPRVRTTELRRRRLVDLVSPTVLLAFSVSAAIALRAPRLDPYQAH
jgi:hypothetical protein